MGGAGMAGAAAGSPQQMMMGMSMDMRAKLMAGIMEE